MDIICIRSWVIITIIISINHTKLYSAFSSNNTKAIFIMGDSTADVGTNTYLPNADISVKSNFPYYGVDFPNQIATGRFSNGFNSADFIAKCFGLNRSPPPYQYLLTLDHHHFRAHLTRGVNFASAGAGLLDQTGSKLGVVPMSEQINQLCSVRHNLTNMLGSHKAQRLLKSSLYFISVGSNDVLGYFFLNSTIPKNQFIGGLISKYSAYIQKLYKLGARKFGIISMPPIGCLPSQRLIHGTGGCWDEMNEHATTFHEALVFLLHNISSELPQFKYSIGNTFRMTMDILKKGVFQVVNSACCGTGNLNAQGPCDAAASLCPDRRQYLFWDAYHPSQAATQLAANTLYSGPTDYVSPINFSRLAY